MSLKEDFIAEMKVEAANTRKLLERVPEDKFSWKPHEKSMTLKALAEHIATLSAYPAVMVKTAYLDFLEIKDDKTAINSTEDLLAKFDRGVQQSIEALSTVEESDFEKKWIMRSGDHIIANMPRKHVLRKMAFNHSYHHRAQLGVYLRLLDIPTPGMYGPSADEKLGLIK